MICSDYRLIFPHSTRWRPWWLFEQEVSAAEDLQPYLCPQPYDFPEPYFSRADDLSQYDTDAFVHSYNKHVVCFEDLDIRQSILFRAKRRRAIANGEDRSVVNELYDKEKEAVIYSFAWTEWPWPYAGYEEWEGYIYTYTQHLLDGYYEGAFKKGFGTVTEELRSPSAAAYNNWALGFLKSGFPSDALGILLRALEIDFSCSYVWHTLHAVYFELGKKDKAAWALEEYYKLAEE